MDAMKTTARWWAALAAGILLLAGGHVRASDVHVMMSAGFAEAWTGIAPAFERASGHKVVTIRGPSMGDSPEAIPARIRRGEPVDVVIMIGAAVDDLGRQGMVQPASKVDLARSQIGMVVRAGAAKPDIASVEAFRRVLLGARSLAWSDSASGTYLSTTLFAKLGVADQVLPKGRKVKGPPSGEPVAAVVARGETEIGFQQVSELLHVPGVTYVGPIPAELQQDTFYSTALATSVRQPDAAAALIRFLRSAEAADAMTRSGLAPVAR